MYYYTMHSPRGAGASFVIGAENEAGGFMLQEGFIPQNDVYIGILDDQVLRCLPFFEREDAPDAEENFDIGTAHKRKIRLCKYKKGEISRTLNISTDRWKTDDFTFELMTPVKGIPNPETSSYYELKRAVAPVVCGRFTVKNRKDYPVTGFFGVQGLKGVYPLSSTSPGVLLGAAGAGGYGFGLDAKKYAGICKEVADFSPGSVFSRTELGFYRNCEMGGFCFNVDPGQEISVEFVLGWYCHGNQTRGLHTMPYYYTRFFPSLESVLADAVEHFSEYEAEARKTDRLFDQQNLSDEQRFFIAQSVHCYWASTMLFDEGGRPRYIVNEGSYMMMNTFDLSVDHLFYECLAQPWSVKNQLNGFWKEYSYYDTLHGTDGCGGLPGGISFTHDQGSYGTFSPLGYSSYEMRNKEGCLSYMSQEQLLNWLLSAAVYLETTRDIRWQKEIQGVVADCLVSLLNRDNPDPDKRDGIMDYDGDRCGKKWEITTYDSLDEGLGQARRNLYIATKTWAAYLAVQRIAEEFSSETARLAEEGARRCADTITSHFHENLGYIPAILDGKSQTAIIPAIEGLVYPFFFGFKDSLSENGKFGNYIKTLKRHLKGVLQIGLCLFSDGGWRLSSGSMNTWMSKVFLCQFVAESILGFSLTNEAGNPYVAQSKWWKVQCSRCPGIDQVVWGQEYSRGFHYPRAVTSVLWVNFAKEMFLP